MQRSKRSNKQPKPKVNNVRRRKPGKRRVLPAAQVMSAPKQFNTIKTNGTTAVVNGCDLVYQIPDSLSTEFQNSQVITIIPCNPAYWLGTRVSALAAGYQNYTPTHFEVIYIPQCAVTQQGNVIGGTLWDQTPNSENLQQTLKTSNGGLLTQCYAKQNAIVKLGNNLQYNLYRMGGAIDQESNPFIYIALGIATTDTNNNRIVPGYFYVKYTYIFKNPIGNSIVYANSQMTKPQNKAKYMINAVCYLCQPIQTINGRLIPTGTRIDIEFNNSNVSPRYKFYYNQTEIDMALLTSVWILENQPYEITENPIVDEKVEIQYTSKSNSGEQLTIDIPVSAGVTMPGSKESESNDWVTYLNTSPYNTATIPINENTDFYRISDTSQMFGTISDISTGGVVRFLIDKALTNLISV
jgi:hypothetical protein